MNRAISDPYRFFRKSWLAWALCGLICIFALINLYLNLKSRPVDDNLIKVISDIAWNVFPIAFASVAALITSRQPRNNIGWLLMTPAIFFVAIAPIDNYLNEFTTAPVITVPVLLMTWFQNWSWLLLVIPLLLILLLFPTGRPPSPRWRWVMLYAWSIAVFLILMATFSQNIQPVNSAWTLPNPIGIIPDNPVIETHIVLPWVANLGLLTILCAVSLFVRYRRAPTIEREQIKWLLFASGVFVIFYVPLLGWQGNSNSLTNDVADLLLMLSTTLFPVSIAIAILRYHLWDIDIVIRRTLIYGLVTAVLALVYFGSVVILQNLLTATGGEHSPIVIVFSTLIIAALFTPLRRRIQYEIDRRFYRTRYDAARTLADFSVKVRDQVELEQLSESLLMVVNDTMRPVHTSLWLRK